MSDLTSPSNSAEATEEVPKETSGFTAPSVQEIQVLLPQFEILEKIGAGGMGAVYKARQPNLDRIVAIKILPTGMDGKFSFKERFKREARAMARLHHPGIITVFEFGETESNDDEPLLYIVMEYVEGADLNYLIKNSKLEVNQTLVVVSQICDALQYAHEQNIVHRDIKPANIMLNMDGNVKIADFGLAKIISTETTPEVSLTGTNIVMGTLDYLAPEQMSADGTVDQRADLYAIGVLIYELLTGEAPRGAFELPSKKVTGLDPRLDYVVVHAMASNPEDRYQSADELSTAILDLGTSDPDSAHEPTPNPEPAAEPGAQSEIDSQATVITPWESTTAKPMPVPDELKPATQADIQAAVSEATRVATQAAQEAAQSSAQYREPSSFWPNLYAAAKTLMVMSIIVIMMLGLGLLAYLYRSEISRMITGTKTSTPTPETSKVSNTSEAAKSTQWQPPKSAPQPTSNTSSGSTQQSKLVPPPPPSGKHPPRGMSPPPRKR